MLDRLPAALDEPTDPSRRSLLAGAGALALAGAFGAFGASPSQAQTATARPRPAFPPEQQAFVDDLEERTFGWFWDVTDAATGMTPDRWPAPSFCSVAAVGFAMTAYPIGVNRGWITRAQAKQRVLTTLRFFWNAPQGPEPSGRAGHKGFFYHFLDMKGGKRFEDTELSTVDTALFLMGALYCREWFSGSDADEAEIRRLADQLYARVEWPWARGDGGGVAMAWHPETGPDTQSWNGYDEAMFVYLLAMGSPTHPLPPDAYREWTRTYPIKAGWGGEFAEPHLQFAPMFGHQYSAVWIDYRGIRDAYMRTKGIDYFENSRRATHAQRNYAIANIHGWTAYGADVWGITACDGPGRYKHRVNDRLRKFAGYAGRGMGGEGTYDDGTLAPTAAGGSIAFAPEICIPALMAMKQRWGGEIYKKYGFLDSFNPSFDFDVKLEMGRRVEGVGWFATDYIAIDQGPIIAAIANHRGDEIWSHMRRADWLKRGLKAAGFDGGWLG